ncbi:MAG: prepilin-type N-terminal cleavage/methylation domain-containing protein [Deltaproteobacteria bacterium]|nr:prepilin-type N-terminal cleavage/methylation domain-containing protein [Deltaproteobacteria bacterium]
MKNKKPFKRSFWRVGFLKNQQGFTLIEILMAVGILATAAISLMGVVTDSADMGAKDEKRLAVTMLAGNKMIELENEFQEDIARGKFPDEAEVAGRFEEPYDQYAWAYSVKKVEIPVMEGNDSEKSAAASGAVKNIMKKLSESVRELKVTVTWGEDDEGKPLESFELTTHLVNTP